LILIYEALNKHAFNKAADDFYNQAGGALLHAMVRLLQGCAAGVIVCVYSENACRQAESVIVGGCVCAHATNS